MPPRISIIVTTFNVAPWIETCVTSALSQTFKDFEAIIVDDGSTDETPHLLRTLKQRDSRVKIVTQENRGLSLARNAGLDVATGDYVLFLDGDDALPDRALEKLDSISSNLKTEILQFSALSFSESTALPEIEDEVPTPTIPVPGRDYFARYLAQTKWAPRAQLLFLSREFLSREHLRFFPGILHEDNLFTFIALCRASRVAFVPQNLYFVRERTGSITRSKKSFEHARGLLVSYLETRQEKYRTAKGLDASSRWGMSHVIERIFVQAGATFWSISWSDRGKILRWLFSQRTTYGLRVIVATAIRLERILYAGTRLIHKARFAALGQWAQRFSRTP
jgi:glycosyltransferase involved in cell wall biosynthesis